MFMVLYGVIYHTSCKMSTFFRNYSFEVSGEPGDYVGTVFSIMMMNTSLKWSTG